MHHRRRHEGRRVICGACSSANEAGRKFCGECGAPLLRDDRGADAAPLVAEAREICERLGAQRSLERVAAIESRALETARTNVV